MECAICHRQVGRPAIREEQGGRVLHFCSLQCLKRSLNHRGDEEGLGTLAELPRV